MKAKIFGILIGLLFTIGLFENCSDVNFKANTAENSINGDLDSDNGNDNSNELISSSPEVCYEYADYESSGPCSAELDQSKINSAIDNNGNVVIRVTFPRNFVDNTYGANSIGWEGIDHPFDKLVGSDHVVLSLYDKSGEVVLNIKLDYISKEKNTQRYYTRVEKTEIGDVTNVIDVRTSLVVNFNELGYILEQDSPATDSNYTQNPLYPDWIFDVWYEVTVKSDAFTSGGGYGKSSIESIHASPSKIEQNTCDVVEAPCKTSSGGEGEPNNGNDYD